MEEFQKSLPDIPLFRNIPDFRKSKSETFDILKFLRRPFNVFKEKWSNVLFFWNKASLIVASSLVKLLG